MIPNSLFLRRLDRVLTLIKSSSDANEIEKLSKDFLEFCDESLFLDRLKPSGFEFLFNVVAGFSMYRLMALRAG